jgi:aspartyl-tRNA(Asn)/glutamyl-tRNA(Gln) amidotransferase subunit A
MTKGDQAVEPSRDLSSAPLWSLSIGEALAALRRGALTASDLVQACIARAAAVDPCIHSYIHLAADEACRRARALDGWPAAERGLLGGIPFAVKATYDVAGMPSNAGSRLRGARVPATDAALVAQLRALDAVCLGQLNTWEFGTGNGGEYFDLPQPPARNPWDTARFTGGSSSGCGTSVAAGTSLFALGSDTTGSVRLPASATGVVGMIPTPGRFSLAGILPNCHSLDVPGTFTRTAHDAALLFAALTGPDAAAAQPFADGLAAQGARGMRVAVLRDPGPGFSQADGALADGFEAALQTIAGLGAVCTEVRLPVSAAECFAVTRLIGPVESAAIHEAELRTQAERMGFALRDKLLAGSLVRAVDYLAAQRRRAEIGEQIRALLDGYDALVTFGSLHLPPLLGVEPEMTAFTVETLLTPFNLSASPALVQCTGFSEGGLPLHWQIVGRQHREADILRLAIAYERATHWRTRLAQPLPHPPAPAAAAPTPDTGSLDEIAAFAARHGLERLAPEHLRRLQQHVAPVARFGDSLQRVADKERAPLAGPPTASPAPPQPPQADLPR